MTSTEKLKQIREEFWKEVKVPGVANGMNPELEKAGRVADFLELGELMCMDALNRNAGAWTGGDGALHAGLQTLPRSKTINPTTHCKRKTLGERIFTSRWQSL